MVNDGEAKIKAVSFEKKLYFPLITILIYTYTAALHAMLTSPGGYKNFKWP